MSKSYTSQHSKRSRCFSHQCAETPETDAETTKSHAEHVRRFFNSGKLTNSLPPVYQYHLPQIERSGFFSNINYSWADSSHSLASSPDATRLGNRSLLNARIGWEWERVTCYVFGTNLLNDEYALYRGEAIPPIIPQAVKAAPSRMIGVGAEIKW